jgi:hypothetical protein
MSNIIIEGVDRLGKGTLIKGLKNATGAQLHIHYEKPELLTFYQNGAITLFNDDNIDATQKEIDAKALELYQMDSFLQMFNMLSAVEMGIILDRAHLGEVVYAKRYRGYSGDYVFELESVIGAGSLIKDVLVLLTASDMSYLEDDGMSFDFNAKEAEQADFIDAFNRSNYRNKLQIDVSLRDESGASVGRYAPASSILHAVLDTRSYGFTERVAFVLKADGQIETVSTIEN